MTGKKPDIKKGTLIELPDRWLVKDADVASLSCCHGREEGGVVTMDLVWVTDPNLSENSLRCVLCSLDAMMGAESAITRSQERSPCGHFKRNLAIETGQGLPRYVCLLCPRTPTP